MEKYNNITESEIEQVDLIELLLDRQAELNTLLEITQAIHQNVSSQILMDMLELILKNSLGIQYFMLIIQDDEGSYKIISSFGDETYDVDNYTSFILEHAEDKKVVDLKDNEDPLLKDFRYFLKIFRKEAALAYVFVGDLLARDKILAKNRINYIRTLINVVIVALENKKLFKERIQKERLQKELELAGRVQNMFIPKELPVNDIFDFHAIYRPHQSIGGDFYDLIKLNDDEFLWCIADVSGKGISAALLMSNFQASLRALAGTALSLEELVAKLNRLVCRNTKGERFITVFLGKFNNKTRKIEYVNSGHAPPILIQNQEVTFLKKGSMMIGVFEELPFINVGTADLEEEALIFNYTDGLVEFDGDEEKTIDEEMLVEFIDRHKTFNLEDIHSRLLSYISKYHQSEEAMDDITLLSLRFR